MYMYLLKFLGYVLIPGQKVTHTPRPRWSFSNLANHVPAELWQLCLWEGVCFWCVWDIPTEKSWETLSDPVIQAGDSWALGSVDCLLSSGVDSMKEGESLLFMSLGSHLICHNTTPSIWHFSSQQDAFLQSMYQEMFHNQGPKTGVLNCRAQGRCISGESMDRGGHWISLVWLDWIFTNDIKLS